MDLNDAVKSPMKELLYDIEGDDSVSIHEVESIDQVRGTWISLEVDCDSHFFHSWCWISAWLQLILKKTKVYFFVYRHAGQLCSCCLLTLCRSHRKKHLVNPRQLQINEHLAHDLNMVNGYGGLLSRKGSEKRSWVMFFKAAGLFNKQWDEILLSSLSLADYELIQNIDHRLKPVLQKTAYHWVKGLQLPDTSTDTFLASFKKKTRKQLRQSITAFSGVYCPAVQAAHSKEEAIDFFKEMGEVHSRRWQANGKKGSYANPHWVDFHRRMINSHFDEGLIMMLRVVCDETIIGYLYGHYYRGKIYMHQTGFPLMSNNKLRPGYVSHFETMRYCAELGAISYDLLPDVADSYKTFFIDAGEPVHWICLKRNKWLYCVEDALELSKRLLSRTGICSSAAL